MTSYRPPDYDVGLKISFEDFRHMAGTAFNIRVGFGKERRRFAGMLIIPQGNDFPDKSSIASAWLWCDGCPDMPVDTHVNIAVGEPGFSMLTAEEHLALSAYKGLRITGILTQSRG